MILSSRKNNLKRQGLLHKVGRGKMHSKRRTKFFGNTPNSKPNIGTKLVDITSLVPEKEFQDGNF